jgi:hypothetical protein
VFIDQPNPLSQPPAELEQLLELEEPSILECFDAVRQAEQAIAEAAALEKKAAATKGEHAPPRQAF